MEWQQLTKQTLLTILVLVSTLPDITQGQFLCEPVNPCQNDGQCFLASETEFFCYCANTGYYGRLCELPLSDLQCPDDEGIVDCPLDPCITDTCLLYPDAVCGHNVCGECKSEFTMDGTVVDCDADCPEDLPPVICDVNPCDVASCPARTDATCRPNFCGSCDAVFYDSDDNPVDCACPADEVVESCPLNQCEGASCPTDPDAECRSSSCGGCSVAFFSNDQEVLDCHEAACPEGVTRFDCALDPCQVTSCPTYPNAICQVNSCGMCASFYVDEEGLGLNCNLDFTCQVEGRTYMTGEVFTSQCRRCVCIMGSVFCSAELIEGCEVAATQEPTTPAADPCDLQPCFNGGTCHSGMQSLFACMCPIGFVGILCETRITIDPCQSFPCRNGGTCNTNGNGFNCECPPQYLGATCETANLCVPSPCLNGGECVLNEDRIPSCICTEGYTGFLCSDLSDPCDSNPCLNGGQCEPEGEGFLCMCGRAFTGDRCEILFDACEGSSICLNGGTCQSISGVASCSCPLGYSGAICEVAPCGLEPCQNRGLCLDIAIGEMPYLCVCMMGFTGSNCQISRNVCDNVPCRNGGVCEEVTSGDVRSFTCQCPDGYTGSTCEETVNPCDNNGDCVNGVCVSLTNTLTFCICPQGYMGPLCDTIIDPCLTLLCENGGSCFSEGDVASCSCGEGYSGTNCEIAESVCLSDPCFNDGTCIPDSLDPRGYVCDCMDNFEGDRCQSFVITPCFPDPCENGVCVISNVDTTEARCLCETGYTGQFCDQQFDPCESNPCQNNGICLTRGLNFFCNCTESYMGDTCTERVLCDPNPCFNGGTCQAGDGDAFECLCPPGYVGTRCNTLPDPCFDNPCVNGDCVPFQRGFSCVCYEGYSGITCEDRENCTCPEDIYVPPSESQSYYQVEWELPRCDGYTVSSSFQSGGYFTRGRSIVTVTMSEGSVVIGSCSFSIFIIDDTLPDPCVPNPCQSGGTCNELQGGNYQCMCPVTHTGRNCTVPVFQNPCDSSPCLNGGFCVEVPGTPLGYLCGCLEGYIGARCEIPDDGCATDPCQNGATCNPENGDAYSCECAPGYGGRDCSEPLSCVSEPCQNFGLCIDLGSFGYICSCLPGYAGPDCNLLDTCSSSPCQNGATCVNEESGFICSCPEGYSGSLCQVSDEECILECPGNLTRVVDAGVTVAAVSWDYQESVCGFPVMFTHLPGSLFPLGVTTVRGAVRGLDVSRECSFTVTVDLLLSPHCVGEPCRNGATCFGNDFDYFCLCADGYSGRNCSERDQLDPCEDNPCRNQGTCVAVEEEYVCLCLEGFTGLNCNQSTVVDVTPPRIDFCPSPITQVALEQDGGAFVYWDEPQATDDSGTTRIAFQNHQSGDFFPFGPTPVRYRIEDPSGNGVYCDFLVTVNARINPPDCTPECPADIVVVTDSMDDLARVFWNQMSTTCNYTISSSHRSGSFFVVGTETVTLEFREGRELVSSCSFDVTVVRGFGAFCTRNLCQNLGTCQELSDGFQCICPQGFAGTICEILTSVDEVNPIVTFCPADVPARTQNGETTVPATWRMPQAVDNSGTVSLSYQSHFPGDQFEVGVTTVVYEFCDPHGNKAMCQFRVIVENIEECEIRCPSNIEKFAETGVEFIPVTWEQPDTMCNLALLASRRPGSFFEIGTSVVTLMLLNNSGVVVQQCQFVVAIRNADLGNPCDNPDVCGTGECFLDLTSSQGFGCECTRCFIGDYCERALPVANPCNSDANLCQNGGSCSFTDCEFLCSCPEGFTGVYCEIESLVRDTTPPTLIGCPMDITRTVNAMDEEAIVTWDEVRYIDSSGTAYFAGSSHSSGDSFPLGLTPVTMIYSDASRNFAYCQFNVIILQVSVGVGCETNVCPEDIMQFSTGELEYMEVFWTQPSVVCGFNVESVPQTGALFPVGESQVTWTMFDSDRIPQAGCVFSVTVTDDFTNPCFNEPCGVSARCLSNPTLPGGFECRCIPGDENCVANAFEGDEDTTPPTVTGCNPREFFLEKGNTHLNLTWAVPRAIGQATVVASHTQPYAFPIGHTIVTYNFTDSSENTATCRLSITITERDTQPPTIFDCPENAIVPEVSGNERHVNVQYTRPTATDLSGILPHKVDPPHHEFGGFFTLGKNHKIVWEFEDNAGNKAMCVIQIDLRGY